MFTDRVANDLSVDVMSQSCVGSEGRAVVKVVGNGSRQGDSEQVNWIEVRILTLMEFSAVSRAEALAIIPNHLRATSAQAIGDALGSYYYTQCVTNWTMTDEV